MKPFLSYIALLACYYFIHVSLNVCMRRIPARAKKQTYASFDDMIQNSPVPVLVDFYATWCGPCVLMAEVLEVRAILLRKQKVQSQQHILWS